MASTTVVIGFADQLVNGASAIDGTVEAVRTGSERFDMVDKVGGVVGSIISMVPALAPISIQANTFNGSVKFFKIVMDLKAGKDPQVGDVLSLVGSVTGIIATVTVLTGIAPTLGLVLTGVGVGINLYNLISGNNIQTLTNYVATVTQDNFATIPVIAMPTIYVTSDGGLATYEEIRDRNLKFGVLNVTPSGTYWAALGYTPAPPMHGTPGTENWTCQTCHD